MGYAAPLVLGSELTITRGQTLRFASVDLAPKVLVPYEVNSIRMLGYPSIEVEDVAAGPSTAPRRAVGPPPPAPPAPPRAGGALGGPFAPPLPHPPRWPDRRSGEPSSRHP